jgi:beta-galactosidase
MTRLGFMLQSALFSGASLLLMVAALEAAILPPAGERRVSFDHDWRFMKGELPGAEAADYDDAAWRGLDVPHDWAIEGPFDPKVSPHQGSLPYFGVAWYRRSFELPESGRGRFYSVLFDGVMSNARVFLNGVELGARPYGYIGFAFDLTPHLRFAGRNVLAVRVAPEDQSSRWYPGAGIYRHVWLEVTGSIHVTRWGTYVTTPSVSEAEATVSVRSEIRNREANPVRAVVSTRLVDAEGVEAATSETAWTVGAAQTESVPSQLVVKRPRRWDLESPHLYRAITTVRVGGEVRDHYETPFGIRSIAWGREKGFLLNGRRVQFQGVCNHHDLGALGAAVNRRATERQLEILKRMGANAIRTSHNPPSPELLDAADRLGLLVMDEAFDMWGRPKVPNGHGKYFAEWGERDLRDMIRRDRNHPSIVMWSIGNEMLEQDMPEGREVARRLTAICHEEDGTRPVTAGFNQVENALQNKLTDEVDIPGFNYGVRRYSKILAEHPAWAIIGAETASCVSSRGVYHLPLEKYEKHPSLQISSYDIIAPRWAYCPDVEFAGLAASPEVMGEFVWTGFDYLGEPTPYFAWDQPREERDWPSRSSYFGIVDLAGFPKDRYFLYQSQWSKEPMVHVLPHWNWKGREGQPIPVMAYTNASEVELFLDGRSLGRKTKGAEPVPIPVGKSASDDPTFATPYRVQWTVPFRPGTLEVVAYAQGRLVARKSVATAGAPAKVVLVPDRRLLTADGEDLSFVTVRIEDRKGNLCPLAENLVRFDISGEGTLAAVDNGNAASLESFQANERKAFGGLALLVVRSKRGRPGSIGISATSAGLRAAQVSLGTK